MINGSVNRDTKHSLELVPLVNKDGVGRVSSGEVAELAEELDPRANTRYSARNGTNRPRTTWK